MTEERMQRLADAMAEYFAKQIEEAENEEQQGKIIEECAVSAIKCGQIIENLSTKSRK